MSVRLSDSLSADALRRRRLLAKWLIYASIVLTAVLLALNYQLFVVENHFAPAGLNGIATMVQYKTGFSIGYMSLLINIPLCIFAYFFVEKRFAVRSLCFCLVYSAAFLFLQRCGLTEFQYNAHGHDTIFPALLSGVISGFVYGVCMRAGASTGGTDIISKFVSIRNPRLNFFWITFFLNTAVAVISFFVYAEPGADGRMIYDYRPICLCILYCFVSSFIGNMLVKGTKSAAKFTIITAHPDEIIEEVYDTIHHGVTRLPAMGSFSNETKTILICVVNRHQIVDFQNILRKYTDTFAFSEPVNETYGNFNRES